VGPKSARRLAELGLREVWEVQRRSERDLVALLGEEGRLLKLRAHGHGGTVLRPDRPPKSVSRETTFSHDLRDPAELEAVLLLFATRVASQLRHEQLVARTVTLKLRHDDFHTVTRRATLPDATDLDRDLFETARQLLVGAFGDARRRNRGVRLIGLAATGLARASAPDLFEPPERERLRRLTAAMDEVREKFGVEAMQPGRLLELKQRRGGPRD
jgi:DNA polymerase-4